MITFSQEDQASGNAPASENARTAPLEMLLISNLQRAEFSRKVPCQFIRN